VLQRFLLNAHLPFQLGPEKRQRGKRVCGQRLPFPALVVGEKHKTALADPALYEADNKARLKEILAAQSEAQRALDAAEAAWTEAAEALQQAEQEQA